MTFRLVHKPISKKRAATIRTRIQSEEWAKEAMQCWKLDRAMGFVKALVDRAMNVSLPSRSIKAFSLERRSRCGLAVLACCLCVTSAFAEDGSSAWLRYAPVANPKAYVQIPSRIVVQSDADAIAAEELQTGLTSMLRRRFTIIRKDKEAAKGRILLSATDTESGSKMRRGYGLAKEEFVIQRNVRARVTTISIRGGSPTARLYGVFHLLEEIASNHPIPQLESSGPSAPIRWTDEWDNLDGTIERGYAGSSIFFDDGHVRSDLTRARQYARILASIGINGCNVNNVNADLDLLTSEHLRELARLAEAFRPWGVRLALSIDLSSPETIGGLDTFDPLDPKVIAWWQAKVEEVYSVIPDFAGFTVKADSERRSGPSKYGRTPVDAANVLARALKPRGGVVLYRGFVYSGLDWHNPKADRARAGYDNFARYDGKFESNVIIQVKEGPIDFQVREAVSPLFAALRNTPQAIEVQISQEYTGQQRHMVFLPSMWKWVLDTDMRVDGKPSTIAGIVTGRRFDHSEGGFVAVTNVGTDLNWLHHPMAMANLYAFGKLAWDPKSNLDSVLDTWARLTWGNDPQTVRIITAMLRNSWRTYEGYTGPFGMGTLTQLGGGTHYGPDPSSAEHNRAGQWFRGDSDGVGMDRTVATGTGYVGQYPPEFGAIYESLSTCPDELLLFFHHVPYTYRLHTGKTLIQSIYDTHYDAARIAAEYVPQWESLQVKVDPQRYKQVLQLLTYQAGHAIVWRDTVDSYFQRIAGIVDEQGRVGSDQNRIEAESMRTGGYQTVDINPREAASGGRAVICLQKDGCSLTAVLQKRQGTYDIAVQYFDLATGVSHYRLSINGKQIAVWNAADDLPPGTVYPYMDGATSTRFILRNVVLRPGDKLQLIGIPDLSEYAGGLHGRHDHPTPPDRRELAPVDYIEIGPDGPITPQ